MPDATNSTSSTEIAEPPQVTRQKYEEAKGELQALLNRKKQVDANLINLENSIYLFEGSYLEDTQQNGNIIRGFEGYLTHRTDRRKPKFTELDRALAQKEDQDSSPDDRSINSLLSSRRDKKRRLKANDGGPFKKKKTLLTDDELDV